MDLIEFEKRKKDHIQLSLKKENQGIGLSGLELIELEHEALPDLNFSDIDISQKSFSLPMKTPFYVSSMTAGHKGAIELNSRMARVSGKMGWMMGVGSQRRQLENNDTLNEWKILRKNAPHTVLLGNLGISQLILSTTDQIRKLMDSIDAQGVFIHLNALQECLQKEGTPQFKGGLKAIKDLIKSLKRPVLIKETGCGISSKTLKRLKDIGVHAVDVSGLGGTHWGRIEGDRSPGDSIYYETAKSFASWGYGTIYSVLDAKKIKPDYEIWASGGVRSGLDAAKLLALGAKSIGFAKPVIEQALKGEKELEDWMKLIEFELRVAMFCTGSRDLKSLRKAPYRYGEGK